MKDLEIHRRFESETIAVNVRDLGKRLTRSWPTNSNPLLISLLTGSVIFVADLVRAIERPVRYEFIDVQYPKGEGSRRIHKLQYPISFNLVNQSIILVRDVTSSGIIESYLRSQFLDQGAASVAIVSLINIEAERKVDFIPEYTLFSCNRIGTFVGYGLKYEARYGNLPYIGEVGRDSK